MAKLVVIEQLYSKDFGEEYYISSSINEDECQNQVGSMFRVYNKKKKDGTQGTFLKFTVNFYHTTSSILVNGNHVEIFESELFQPLCKQIELRCSELSIVNEQIADALTKESGGSQSKPITDSETITSTDCVGWNDNKTCATHEPVEMSAWSPEDNEEHDSEKLYLCPSCDKSSIEGAMWRMVPLFVCWAKRILS
ncbi:MAG: hypothetical protein N0E59_22575 [Candidatus Thiodiazotropha taylori]|nr:hypothetical protein [Candidatus Thiodiazotropha taylori]MCW4285905.1 hypothetical protein [Candidatus Thiodiazotropha taylori]